MRLHGKSALVTGGARGIGKAIGETLLQHGAKVCLMDILDGELRTAWTELKQKYGESSVTTHRADVTNKEEFSAAFQHTVSVFGQIDILVNNACLQREKQWEDMLRVNLGGVIQGTLLALQFMDAGRGGTVVNISSDCGVDVIHGDTSNLPVYTTSKAGVIAYTKCFALNNAVLKKKIRLVCLCPRPTDTCLLHDYSPEKCWDIDAFYAADRGPLMSPHEVGAILISILQDATNHGKIAAILGPNNYSFV